MHAEMTCLNLQNELLWLHCHAQTANNEIHQL